MVSNGPSAIDANDNHVEVLDRTGQVLAEIDGNKPFVAKRILEEIRRSTDQNYPPGIRRQERAAMNLSVSLGRLKLDNPIMVASGTFGYAREMEGIVDLPRLGRDLAQNDHG